MSVLTPDALASFRQGDRVDAYLTVAFAVGVVAGLLHPAGLAVGGALVGLAARSLERALVLGLALGSTVLLAWGVVLLWYGTLGPVAGAVPLSAVAVAAGLGVPALASVGLRGLV